jgi:hypothetical protein
MKYELKNEDFSRVAKDFSYHAPKDDQPERYVTIRDTAAAFALGLMQTCPSSRERSLALTALEECVMWANASIARNE